MQHMEFFLLSCILAAVVVHCRGQPGFINIDCGYPGNDNYTNKLTGLTYVPDAQYIDTGENHKISSAYLNSSSLAEQNFYLRSFPSGKRNCYSLPVEPGKKYLIRAGFMYGNYDGQNRVPQFDVYVGVICLGTMMIKDGSFPHGMEVMVVASTKILPVCLVNKDLGSPFISSLELRALDSLLYTALNESNYFLPFQKLDMGSLASRATRYPDDLYDRMWFAGVSPAWHPVNTSSSIISLPNDGFNVPSTVMRTAVEPSDGLSINFSWNMTDPTASSAQYDIFIHFAEIDNNASRIVDVYLNGEALKQGFTPRYLKADTIPITNLSPRTYNLTIAKAAGSTLPPRLNAIEAYGIGSFTELATYNGDVDAIMVVKSTYHLKSWMGDPCVPQNFTWGGLNCSFSSATPPRIIYINLANSALSGEIAPSFANLTNLTYLDLSGNSLTGSIPDALGELPSLQVLNLSNNHLSGSIPALLQERSAKNSLILCIDGNPDICQGSSCRKKKKTLAVIITVVAIVVVLIFVMAAFLLWRSRRNRGKDGPNVQENKKIQSILPENQQFTYQGLAVITGNFEHPIGKGGFGTVYLGMLGDGTQVAVKVRSQTSSQGKREFQAEAQLLTRIHHKNLVPLVGYCNDDNYLALVYEYMAEGSLEDRLRGKPSHTRTLKWFERLRIAIEAAQGLEYLHSGCKPPVVHRDVKSSNILLDHKCQAKIADFGLSKVFDSDATHISTNVVGTEGYLDPEYYLTCRLTDKSDVFSYGVVLLELITGLPPIIRNPDRGHISHWISPMLARGDIGCVVDDRMQHEFNSNSVWKTAEIAMKCTRPTTADRPTMSEVVIKLKECLALEISSGRSDVGDTSGFDIDLSDSFESPSKFMTAAMLPHVR